MFAVADMGHRTDGLLVEINLRGQLNLSTSCGIIFIPHFGQAGNYTAKFKILSKKKILVSSKTWLEIRYQVKFVLPSKRVYLKQVHM
jgi:hypothetical protein